MGYGFGTRYLIDKNLYLNLEIQKISFNKVDQTTGGTNRSIQTTGTVGTVGIGYKF
jgi:opacity protein-like surface antigen